MLCRLKPVARGLCASLAGPLRVQIRHASQVARSRRAMLYAPGSSVKMMSKAAGLDVDSICLDLEDAVAMDSKAEARANVVEALATLDFGASERLVRINAIGSGLEMADLNAILAGPVRPDGIVIPKLDHANHVLAVVPRILEANILHGSNMRLLGIIENAKGIVALDSIAKASDLLDGLIFGADDYAADMGAIRTESNDEVAFARNVMLLHCVANGLQAIDLVNIDFHNEARLLTECAVGFGMGYTGKQVIHPKQIGPVQRAFSPSSDKIKWAQQVVAANAEQKGLGKGAFALEGQMIDLPTVKQAEHVLSRAKAAGLV